jgi:hypothetical protein
MVFDTPSVQTLPRARQPPTVYPVSAETKSLLHIPRPHGLQTALQTMRWITAQPIRPEAFAQSQHRLFAALPHIGNGLYLQTGFCCLR